MRLIRLCFSRETFLFLTAEEDASAGVDNVTPLSPGARFSLGDEARAFVFFF